MQQRFEELTVRTRGRGLHEITHSILEWLQRTGAGDGLLTVHLMHTSASLLIQENADPDVRRDLDAFFERLVPDGDDIYVHTAEGEDDMPAHVRTALTTVHLSLPVRDGRPALGTWQGIYIWEHRRRPHSRHVALHFIGEV